jgi:hypothetical protein
MLELATLTIASLVAGFVNAIAGGGGGGGSDNNEPLLILPSLASDANWLRMLLHRKISVTKK